MKNDIRNCMHVRTTRTHKYYAAINWGSSGVRNDYEFETEQERKSFMRGVAAAMSASRWQSRNSRAVSELIMHDSTWKLSDRDHVNFIDQLFCPCCDQLQDFYWLQDPDDPDIYKEEEPDGWASIKQALDTCTDDGVDKLLKIIETNADVDLESLICEKCSDAVLHPAYK